MAMDDRLSEGNGFSPTVSVSGLNLKLVGDEVCKLSAWV